MPSAVDGVVDLVAGASRTPGQGEHPTNDSVAARSGLAGSQRSWAYRLELRLPDGLPVGRIGFALAPACRAPHGDATEAPTVSGSSAGRDLAAGLLRFHAAGSARGGCGADDLGPFAQGHQQRRGEEDRRVVTGQDAYQLTSARSFSVLTPSIHTATTINALIGSAEIRPVLDRLEGLLIARLLFGTCAGCAGSRGCFFDLVEHDDGVVDRIAQNRQQTDHGARVTSHPTSE